MDHPGSAFRGFGLNILSFHVAVKHMEQEFVVRMIQSLYIVLCHMIPARWNNLLLINKDKKQQDVKDNFKRRVFDVLAPNPYTYPM